MPVKEGHQGSIKVGGLISLPGRPVDWVVALAGVYAPDPRQTQRIHPFIHPSAISGVLGRKLFLCMRLFARGFRMVIKGPLL
jgi:hypothetical protein